MHALASLAFRNPALRRKMRRKKSADVVLNSFIPEHERSIDEVDVPKVQADVLMHCADVAEVHENDAAGRPDQREHLVQYRESVDCVIQGIRRKRNVETMR